MRMLIISHTPHYMSGQQVVGLAATVREIDHLSSLFRTVTHLAPLHTGSPPLNMSPYASSRVVYYAVAPAGGHRVSDKLKILYRYPSYLNAIVQELKKADVVHVRCPANISLLAIVLLAFLSKPRLRWIKYAGNWQPVCREPWSSRFQRWWLKRGFHRGFVTVNGNWINQPAHVRQFINPCLSFEELQVAADTARAKTLSYPLRLLFVGAINEAKGVGRALQVIQRLRKKAVPVVFDIIGDGISRNKFESLATELDIADYVHFHGTLSRTELNDFYAQGHIMLLPTAGEGWPKVLSESMAYGMVPVSSCVGSIPQYLEQYHVGKALDPYNVEAFAEAIVTYYSYPDIWRQESLNGMELARQFTYSHYLQDVCDLLDLTN